MRSFNLIVKRIFYISLVVVFVTALLLAYNIFFVSPSITNLHFVSKKLEDIKFIEQATQLEAYVQQLILEELSQIEPSLYILSELEFVQELLKSPIDLAQLDDVREFLSDVRQIKTQERTGVISYLDKLITNLAPARAKEVPISSLISRADTISKQIPLIKERDSLQEGFFELGNIHIRLKEFAKAQEEFSRAIELDSQSAIAKRAKFNSAWVYKIQENADLALEGFKELMLEYPRTELAAYSQFQIGTIKKSQKLVYEALNSYNFVLSNTPSPFFSLLAQFQIAYLYLYNPILNNYQSALKNFNQIIDQFPSSSLAGHIRRKVVPRIAVYYCNRGFLFLSLNKYKQALEQFSLSLKIDPNYGSSYSGRSLVYLWLGNKDKALQEAKKAKEVAPKDPLVSVNLGFIYIRLKMFDQAIEEYKRIISIYPKSKEAYYNLGYIYVVKGDFDGALTHFKQASKIDPKFSRAYNNIGYILWHNGKYAAAITEFKKAVQLRYNYSGAHFNLALSYMIQGRYADARNEFEIVLKLKPEDPVAAANLKELDRILDDS